MQDLDRSARHIIYAIKYSNENANYGYENLDKIFTNFNPNTKNMLKGFDRNFIMNIDDRELNLKLTFATPDNVNGNYNPIVNFCFTTTSQTGKGPIDGYYWHYFYLGGGRAAYGPRIGVGDLQHNSWINFNYLKSWLFNR
jgi:hypothetical protein